MPKYVNLTAHLVETAKPPAHGQRFIRDIQLQGFALRITDKGAKSYMVEVWINGRSRRETIGRADRLELKDARRAARLANMHKAWTLWRKSALSGQSLSH